MKTLNYLQNLSTGISLVVLSVGFPLLGILSFVNRHHEAEAASRYLNNSFCVAGTVVSLLTGATFLFAACLYSRIRVAYVLLVQRVLGSYSIWSDSMTDVFIDSPDRGCSPVTVSDVAHELAREIFY
jgi:hypothetical protein